MYSTSFVIEITPLQQDYSCLLLVQAGYRYLGIDSEVLIAIGIVLIVHGNKNTFHHMLICIYCIYAIEI